MAEKQNIFKFLHKTVTLNLIWQDNCSALLLGSITNLKAMKLSHSSLKFNNIRYNFRFLSSRLLAAEESVKKTTWSFGAKYPISMGTKNRDTSLDFTSTNFSNAKHQVSSFSTFWRYLDIGCKVRVNMIWL